jgi:hypothetical protein
MSQHEEPVFTAAHVKDATGLSYRQLNDWDQRGALPESREGDGEWRRFSMKGLFVLLVCTELRNKFGVPLESLSWLQKCMMQEGANHFAAAVDLMRQGFSVLLLTDLKETFDMGTDLDISALLYAGITRHEEPEAFVLLKVNPLVNKLLGVLKEPSELKIRDSVYELIHGVHAELRLKNAEEIGILRLIRSGKYSKVVIKFADGRVVRTDAESEHGVLSSEALVALLREEPFQSVTVTKQDGKTVRVTRTIPNATGRTQKRQDTPERRRPPVRK